MRLAAYALQKLVHTALLLAGVVGLIFVLLELAPGDVCDSWISPELDAMTIAGLRASLGCDLPAAERALRVLRSLVTFDLGMSTSTQRPVLDLIREAAPNTLLLSVVTVGVAQVVGASIGVVQAMRGGRVDRLLSLATLTIASVPHFWLAMLLVLVASPPLPGAGMVDPVLHEALSPVGRLLDRGVHLILPGAALGIAAITVHARYMRAAMGEALAQDYIRTARAKGLSERDVVLRHALRNALLPMITLLGLELPTLFSGAVVTETVFAWPGMGRVMVGAILRQDVPLLTGCALVFATLVVLGGVLADMLHRLVDPRLRAP